MNLIAMSQWMSKHLIEEKNQIRNDFIEIPKIKSARSAQIDSKSIVNVLLCALAQYVQYQENRRHWKSASRRSGIWFSLTPSKSKSQKMHILA